MLRVETFRGMSISRLAVRVPIAARPYNIRRRFVLDWTDLSESDGLENNELDRVCLARELPN